MKNEEGKKRLKEIAVDYFITFFVVVVIVVNLNLDLCVFVCVRFFSNYKLCKNKKQNYIYFSILF